MNYKHLTPQKVAQKPPAHAWTDDGDKLTFSRADAPVVGPGGGWTGFCIHQTRPLIKIEHDRSGMSHLVPLGVLRELADYFDPEGSES